MSNQNPHVGGSFDEFLADEGILEEVTERAAKRVLAMSFAQAFRSSGITKTALADAMKTNRKQVNRLLDEEDTGITLHTIVTAAQALGGRLRISYEADDDENHAATV